MCSTCIEPVPAHPEHGRADVREEDVVGLLEVRTEAPAVAHDERSHEGRAPRADVHHVASREVHHARPDEKPVRVPMKGSNSMR